MKPNYWDCQECEHWDDINGCWANKTSYCGKVEEDEECDELEKMERKE